MCVFSVFCTRHSCDSEGSVRSAPKKQDLVSNMSRPPGSEGMSSAGLPVTARRQVGSLPVAARRPTGSLPVAARRPTGSLPVAAHGPVGTLPVTEHNTASGQLWSQRTGESDYSGFYQEG